jgi:hypothetical protein
MILQESERMKEVWREVGTWPVKSRVMLATRILQSVEETITTAGPPSDDRRRAIEQLIGFARTENPPDDAAVEQILVEERLEKHTDAAAMSGRIA